MSKCIYNSAYSHHDYRIGGEVDDLFHNYYIIMKKTQKGFTLIELLVVIAIIGVLSAIVLASLNTARAKGQDAAIKSQMRSLVSQGSLYFDNNNYYTANASSTTCTTGMYADTNVQNIVKGIQSITTFSTCYAATTTFMAVASLKYGVNGTMVWCVDASGNATATNGNATTYTCI